MLPLGCNRFCSRCATTIHDLEKCTPDEVEALLSSPEPVWVRVRKGRGREVATRSEPNGKFRRVVVAAAASIGMLAMSSAAIAAAEGPEGIIAGSIYGATGQTKVVAIAADGTRHEVKTDRKGRFRIKHLAPGTYDLEFSYGDTVWTGKSVVVEDERITYYNTSDPDAPIIVGVMSRGLDYDL
jgi:hypothetical protein